VVPPGRARYRVGCADPGTLGRQARRPPEQAPPGGRRPLSFATLRSRLVLSQHKPRRLLQRPAVQRVAFTFVAVLALGVGVASRGSRLPLPCGLPQAAPLWVDYADGMVPFWSTVFAHPGVVGAASNEIVPPQLRAKGAQTVYFDLYLNKRVGTPSSPADP